jgi:hypothetical protein
LTDYAAQPPGVGWLFGRNAELESIRTLLDTAATQGGSLLLTGDAGVGKSVLLDAAAKMASATGIRVVRVDGVQFQAGVGFLGLDQLLAPLSAELRCVSSTYQGALSTALGLGDGPCADRLVVSNATLAVLREATSAGPLLVVADDVQWLDRPSADVLAFVARRLAGSRIGLIAASRPGSSGSFQSAGLPEAEIRPLDEDAAAGLVGTRFPTLAATVQQRVLAEAQGNPLALLELPAALSGAQRTAQESLPEVLPLSRRLEDLFASRVGDLPAATRELLLIMALEGTGHLCVLQATAGGGLAALGPAERTRLVSIDTSTRRVEFRHPLVRSTVVGLSTAIDRRRAHRALARVFIGTPERRAWHLAAATREPDEKVALLLEQAARRTLARGDAAGAVTALKRAAELSPRRSDRGRRLLEAVYLEPRSTGT